MTDEPDLSGKLVYTVTAVDGSRFLLSEGERFPSHTLDAASWHLVYGKSKPVLTAIDKLHDQRANHLRFKLELE